MDAGGRPSAKARGHLAAAFVCYWGWNYCVLVTCAFSRNLADGILGNSWFWSSLFHIATILAFARLARRFAPYRSSLAVAIGGPAGCLGGLALFLGAPEGPLAATVASLLGSAVIGIGTGCLVIPWAERFTSEVPRLRRHTTFAWAMVAGAILDLGLLASPQWLSTILLLALPVCSALLTQLGGASRQADDRPEAPEADLVAGHADGREDGPAPAVGGTGKDARGLMSGLLPLCLVYSLPLGLFQTWAGDLGLSPAGQLLELAIAALLLSLVALMTGRVERGGNAARLFWLALPLTVAGLFVLAFGGQMALVIAGALLFSATQALCTSLYPLFSDLADTRGLPPSVTFGRGIAAIDGGFVAGVALGSAIPPTGAALSLGVILGVAYLVVMASFVQMHNGPRALRPEVDELGSGHPPVEDGTRAAVSRLAARCQLTERESQVALALLGGRSAAAIASQIGLSASTVRTHIAHLYQKAGVHSKDELIDLVDRLSKLEPVEDDRP